MLYVFYMLHATIHIALLTKAAIRYLLSVYSWLRLVLFLQTEIERLRRQIAEKEAAKKAAQVQTPTVTKVTASQGTSFPLVVRAYATRSDVSPADYSR